MLRSDTHSRAVVVCLPPAGGGHVLTSQWRDFFASQEIGLERVVLPGHLGRLREAPIGTMTSLLDFLEYHLVPVVRGTAFVLFGHSLGGLVAFELARRLVRDFGMGPRHLFVAACSAPHSFRGDRHIATLPDPAFLQRIRDLGGIPDEIWSNRPLLEVLVPALRADFILAANYVYEHANPLDCPITAFAAMNDQLVSTRAIGAWRRYTRSSFKIRHFRSGHFFTEAISRSMADEIVAEAKDSRSRDSNHSRVTDRRNW